MQLDMDFPYGNFHSTTRAQHARFQGKEFTYLRALTYC